MKKRTKLWAGGVVVFLGLISFFIGLKFHSFSASGEVSKENVQQNIGWNTYKNHGFSIEYPPEYLVSEGKDKDITSFIFSDGAGGGFTGFISFTEATSTLKEFLVASDKIAETANEGQPASEILESEDVNIKDYEAVIREENWLAPGFLTKVAYIKIGEKVYVFSLLPKAEDSYTESEAEVFQKFVESFKLL